MRGLIGMATACVTLLALTGCERWKLDRQMEELCKKDGGIKVYETVTLPASYFDSSGALKLGPSMPADVVRPGYRKDFQRIGDDEYRYVITATVAAGRVDDKPERGEGRVARYHVAIYRQADKKALGEYVQYERRGGTLMTLGFEPGGAICPDPRYDLLQRVFLKGK